MPMPIAPLTSISAKSFAEIEKTSVVFKKTAVDTNMTSATQFLKRFRPNGVTKVTALL